MTKEELRVKLEIRAAKQLREQEDAARAEKERFDQQISRLVGLAGEMKEDIEMERMMRANGIHNSDFCWDGNTKRHEGVGFEAGDAEMQYIVKNLYASGLTADDTLVLFNPWSPEDGFCIDKGAKGQENVGKYAPTAEFVEDFCNRYEGFHEDYHAWLSSGDWDDWDVGIK